MKVIQLTYPLNETNYDQSIVAIGFFDGVHLGHQQVINRACKIAKNNNLPCGVMTFVPHPKEVMGIKEKIDQITPINSKLRQLEKTGVDIVYLVEFTKEFASISPQDFIDSFLIKLDIKGVVVGFDFTFGYKGIGTPKTLAEKSDGRFTVDIIEPFYDQGEKVSSTRVRDCLLNGKVIEAKHLLGRNYSFIGRVVHGHKRGRTIGFPTANLEFAEDYLDIKNGVYVVKVNYKGETYTGVMNIGVKPTFTGDNKLTYEVYIIDFEKQDIYDETLEIEVVDYIRTERKFNNIEDLKQQIALDVDFAKQASANIV